jgi:autoinducer 2 (AI-2) kinase
VGAGVFTDLDEGAQTLARTAPPRTPDPDATRFYDGWYGDWNAVREARAEADLLLSGSLVEALAQKRAKESTTVKDPDFRPRILATADIGAETLDALREMADVEYASYRDVMRLLAGDELVEALEGVHVFITEVDVVDAEALHQLPDLRAVAVCRGNPVNVDISACTALGIPVIHTPGRNADAVADLTLAYMLMLARKLPQAADFLREPGGEAGDMGRMGMAHTQFQGNELWGKTVGLVGLGAVGRRTAQRLLPFGARILVHDPYVTPEQAVLSGAEKVPLDDLLTESDFVSLHAPATPETRSMIGREALGKMKPGAYLINVARAALVDDAALLEALRSGHLGGAALDVFSVEPPGSDDPLLALPNVIATPHIGGNTFEVASHQGQIVLDELRRLLHRETPQHVCNPETLSDFSWTGPRTALAAGLAEQLAAGPGPAVSDLEVETKPAPPAQEKGQGGILSGLRKRLGGEKEPSPIAGDGKSTADVRAHIELILKAFVEKVATDEGLRDFSKGKDVTMHFFVTDLDLDFHLSFQDGTVISAMGPPPGDADVVLKMKADILDGMFTGRVSGTRAALSGKLSFKGDTAKAMAFQRVQKPMSALYSAARVEIGDPGDLAHLAEPPSSSQAVQQAAAAYAAPEGNSAVHRVGDVRDELLEVLNLLYGRGWITGLGGNISARVEGTESQVWITPGGISKGRLRADMMVRIDLDGNQLDPGALAPSSEWRFHCAIFRSRPDVNAVVHTHTPQTTILGMTDKPFLPISTESAFIGDLPRVPFTLPGTQELSDAVAGAMEQGIAVIMLNHGLVVAGSSLQRAVDMTEVIEVTSEKILTCHMLGQEPPVLPDDVVAHLREIGELMV